MADHDPLSTTHQSRRQQVLKTDNDNDTILYKIILSFNGIMTVATTCLRYFKVSFTHEEGISNYSNLRIIFYSVLLLGYFIFGFMALVYRLCPNGSVKVLSKHCWLELSKHCGNLTAKDVISKGLVDVSLIIAGVLYLAGDNIRMIYRDFETEVPIGAAEVPAREVRSYLVAMSLVFMIVSRIAPLIGEQIYNYRKIPQHCQLTIEHEENVSLSDFWKTSKQTLYVPAGLHDDWKTKMSFKLTPEGEPNPLRVESNNQILFTGKCVMCDEIDGISESRTEDHIKISVKIFFFWNNLLPEFRVTVNEIIVENKPECNPQKVLIRGERSTHVNKKGTNNYNKYSAEFVVKTEDSSRDISSSPAVETVPEIPKIQESALTKLFGAYYKAIDYAVIIDAIYTTILDELTQGSKGNPSSDNCPQGQIYLTFAILLLVTIMWWVAIGCLLPCGFCCCIRYKYMTKWKKIKSHLCYKPKTIKFAWCSSWTDQTHGYDSLENQQQSITVTCCPRPCNIDKCKIAFKVMMFIECLILLAVCLSILLVGIVVFPFGIFMLIVLCTYCCRCCKCYYEEYCGTVFLTFSLVFLMLIYLPVYMISDNSWPWICFIPEGTWTKIRFIILVFSFTISTSPTIYKHSRTWVHEKLHKLEAKMMEQIPMKCNQ